MCPRPGFPHWWHLVIAVMQNSSVDSLSWMVFTEEPDNCDRIMTSISPSRHTDYCHTPYLYMGRKLHKTWLFFFEQSMVI